LSNLFLWLHRKNAEFAERNSFYVTLMNLYKFVSTSHPLKRQDKRRGQCHGFRSLVAGLSPREQGSTLDQTLWDFYAKAAI